MRLTPKAIEAGRFLAPYLARILPSGSPLLSLLEAYLAYIHGKGSGGGWDLQGEASVALPYVQRSNAIIFDVGAHYGEWSQAILGLLKPDSRFRLFQFEPFVHNLTVLRSRTLPRTTIIEAAVSDKSGKAKLYTIDPHSSAALRHPLDAWSHIPSLHQRRESQLQRYSFVEEEVELVTVDETIERFGIDSIDFMKLDVEGNELAVLYGSQKALQLKQIRALTFEFGCGNVNSRTFFHDFWDLLKKYGYSIKRICPGGILLEITEYREDLEFFRGVSNYLATLD